MNIPYVVIGAGAGGLVIALGLAKAGRTVLLIEKGHWGGDCTNFGCIPSKALIAAAKRKDPHALKRVQEIVTQVRSHEEPEALRRMGVETIQGEARFLDPHTIEVNGEKIYAKKIVIAAGSSPFLPPIPGLADTPYLTNETIFHLPSPPKSLIVLGGGPIGCELAQAFQRLGTTVSLIHTHDRLLTREPKRASDVLIEVFRKEGIRLYLGESPERVSYLENQFRVACKETISAEKLLVAVGRRPNLQRLSLNHAKIDFSEKGIHIDRFGRTSQKHIFAIGDITGPPFFTHRAENQARSVLISLLLAPFFKKKLSKQPIPRVTYTDPEIASIGLSEEEAADGIATYEIPLTQVDRAITQDRTEGFVKIITKKWSSKILGATLVAPHAGEMLGQISLAMAAKWPLRKLASLIYPYPTYNLAIRRAADRWLTQTLFSLWKK